MQVSFERSGFHPFTMHIEFFDTVPEIKRKIQNYYGIPISEQTLIFDNTVLSDDLNIFFSNIMEDSCIQLVVTSDSAAHPAKRKRISAELLPPPPPPPPPPPTPTPTPTSPAANGKKKVENHELIRENVEPELRVVVVYEGKKIPVEVGMEERVAELRKKLEEMEVKLPEEGCFFIHKQDLMEDEETFRWHKVNEGDAIDMFGGRVTGGS